MGDPGFHARLEVQSAAESMLRHLRPIAERNPGAVTSGVEFNALLQRAHGVFPDSAVIGAIIRVEGGASLPDLVGKLAVLVGAAQADTMARTIEEADEHNRSTQSWWREFNR